MNIGIKEIRAFIPEMRIDNVEQGQSVGAEAEFILGKIGMQALSRKLPEQDTSDLAVAAAQSLFQQSQLNPLDVECLVLVTQNPDARGLPHTSAIVHQRLGLQSNCATFDISLGCSGFVQGLAVVKAFMQSQGMRNGLLITADPYSKIIDPGDRDTALLFGDGACACWLSDHPVWRIGACDFGIQSAQSDALRIQDSGHLYMNGRAVFNFAATQVPASVRRVLSLAELSIDDIDTVLLHQGSRYIVETLSKRIGAEGKVPFGAGNYGNTVSSSIPILMTNHLPSHASRLLLCGFGVGLSWATCILEKNHDQF